MGRNVTGTGLRIDKKLSMVNVKSNGTNNGEVHVAAKASLETVEMKDYETNDHNQMQEVLGIKSTNHTSEEKIIRSESQQSSEKKSSTPMKPASDSTINGTADASSSESVTPSVEDGKQMSFTEYANGTETNVPDSNFSSQYEDITSKTPKKSQPISPTMSAKQQRTHHKYYDDDDNWSLTSSTATSVRTNKTKITVPVAPRFTCVNRMERRKEYYVKLEEKHKALEKEKVEYEARTKEEEAAAIKQLRKNMSYKANPVPSFYREGPSPKPELKKLPVTRAKSPNFTPSRRKSYGDVVKASPEDNGLQGRAVRRSVGALREGKNSPITPKGKDRIGRKLNETSKNRGQTKNNSKESKQAIENPKVKVHVDVDADNVVES